MEGRKRRKRKKQDAGRPKLVTNLFVTKQPALKRVSCSVFSLEMASSEGKQGIRNDTTAYRLLHGTATRLLQEGIPAAVISRKLYVVSDQLSDDLIDDEHFRLEAVVTLDSTNSESRYALKKIGESIIKILARRNGFPNQQGKKLYASAHDKKGAIHVHEAFEFEVYITPDGHLIVALDSTTRWTLTVQSYIEHRRENNGDDESLIAENLKGSKVWRLGSDGRWTTAEIVDVEWTEVQNKAVDGTPLHDYWNEHYGQLLEQEGLVIDPADKPILKLKVGSLVLDYPASTCRIDIDLRESEIVDEAQKSRVKLKPHQKLQEIQNVAGAVLTSSRLGNIKVDFEREPLFVDDQRVTSVFQHVELSSPKLSYQNDQSWEVRKDLDVLSGLSKFGPLCGEKDLAIILSHPPSVSSELVAEFIQQIKDKMRELKLGTLKILQEAKGADVGAAYNQVALDIAEQVEQLEKTECGKKMDVVALIILPRRQKDVAYRHVKRILGERGIRSQCVNSANLDLYLSKKGPLTILTLNIVMEAFNPGDELWLLDDPAGGWTDIRPIIAALDMSRSLEDRRTYVADMVMFDARGRLLDAGEMLPLKSEILSAEDAEIWIHDRLKKVLSAFRREASREKMPNCVMYLHDGSLRRPQVKNFQEGITKATEKIKEEFGLSMLDVVIVALEKTDVLRLFSKSGRYIENPLPRHALIEKSTGTVHLFTSRPFQSTTAGWRATIRFSTNDKITSRRLAEFLYHLRFLDMASPYVQPKLPIVAHMVHNKAYQSRFGKVVHVPF